MQTLSGIDRARLALERGERLPAGALTAAVAESWQRCRDHGLDPCASPRGEVVPFAEINRKRETVAALRRLALAEMKLLHGQIAGSNFMIVLGDAEGVVLDTIGDAVFADSSTGRGIIPGSVWREDTHGTNALGLAARTGEAVAIYGREHFFACHDRLSCMAAPVFDSRGQVRGLLDASCSNEARQQHTHALVRMAAAQITNGLIFHECSGSFIFAFHPRVEYLDTLSAGLISVSAEGEVLSINLPGQALLAGLPTTAGGSFDRLFRTGFGVAMDGLMKGGIMRIRDQAGSAVFMVCRQIGRQRAQSARSRSKIAPPACPAADFVCADEVLRRAMADLEAACALRMPVHITGETGTGKELMARQVHHASRRKGEFVAVNCGAVAESLFVAEIFGHARGAFTGARTDGAPGLAQMADGGTLFLDEVADIPPSAQTALLRFLDSNEVRPVGASATRVVDVQIVSATNRNLAELVATRSFRADLFYRLNGLSIALPPLARRSDFGAIVRHLVQQAAPGVAVTDAAIARLATHPWPGNIRELQSALQRALIRREAEFLDEDAFLVGDKHSVSDSCATCRGHPLDERRCGAIRATWREAGGNVSQVARRLGLSRTTVYKHVG